MIEFRINNTLIDVDIDIPIPLTFSVADIKDPSKRKQNFSKTFNVVGSQNNLSFFRSAWALSISDVNGSGFGINYDPLLKYPATVRRHGKLIFDGFASLKQIKINNGVYTFEITLFSNLVGIYDTLGDLNISELGWDDYNFVLSVANVRSRMTNSTGLDVWYPLVNYGFQTNLLKFKTNQLFPHVSYFEILKKIFEIVGLNISSTFINSALFKRFFIGHGGGTLPELTAGQVTERRVNYSFDGAQTRYQTSVFSGFLNVVSFSSYFNIDGTGFTDTLINDDLSQFDIPNGIIDVANTGSYKINVVASIDISAGATAGVSATGNVTNTLLMFRNNVLIKQIPNSALISSGSSGVVNQVFSFEQELYLNAGDELKLLFQSDFYAQQPTPFTGFTTLDLDNNFSFDLTSINPVIVDGDTVVISSLLPEYKCSRFLKDVILMFNLYIDETDEENTLLIEPYNDYYLDTNDTEDWSDKVDYSKDITIKPAGLLEGKNYIFKFATDRDHYKQLYFEEFGHEYGDRNITIPTNFAQGDKVFEIGMAQTCPVEIAGSDLIVPMIVRLNQNTLLFEPYKGKPRTYINNGLVACDDWQLVNSDTGTETTYNTYPQAHHLDNLTTATFDLNFGAPQRVYYVATTYTNDNLYIRYWSSFINETTGRDSKLVSKYINITEVDIYKGMMRKQVNIDGVVYKKNLITDYQANGNQTTMVELIRTLVGKSRNKTIFVPAYEVQSGYEPVMRITNIDDIVHTLRPEETFVIGVPTASSRVYTVDPAKMIVGIKYTISNAGVRTIILTPSSGTVNGGATYNIGANTSVNFLTDGTNLYII